MPILEPSNLPKLISDKYALLNNALVQNVKKDVRDTISAEIGDTKDATTFHPQVKITRWDNEVNFSLRLKHSEKTPTIEFDGEKTKWKGAKVEAHFYDFPKSLEHTEGAIEFEILLKEKPDTNIVEFSLNTKGLNFYRQHIPTEVELLDTKRKINKDERIWGSYVVYATEEKFNYTDGKEYKRGKVGQIYRPQIIDFVGTKVWGVLNVDSKKGILSVTIPQDFLDNAVYPVRHAAGLTFGYTTTPNYGADSISGAGSVIGDEYASPSGTNVVQSITISCQAWGETKHFKALLVLHSTNNIVTNGIGAEQTALSYKTWKTSAFATPPSISASTVYKLMAITEDEQQFDIFYDEGESDDVMYYDNTNNYSSPANLGTTGANTYEIGSVYATYTEGGGATNVEVTPSAQNAIVAIVAPTISAVRNIESTPAAQAVTAALLAAAVGIGSLFGATQANATMAIIAPTVSAVRVINIAPAVQNSNFALLSNVITANRTVNTGPSVQNANFALVASVVTAVRAVTVSLNAQNGIFSTQSATITAVQAVNIVPGVQNTTFALGSANVSAVRTVDISASTQNATFATASPAISAIQNINIAPNTQNGTIALLAVSITSIGTVEVAPAAQNGTFALPSATVSCVIAVQINPAVINATFADVAPAVTYGNNIAVSCDNATFALPIVSVSYGLNAFPLTQNADLALSAATITTVQAVNVASTVLNAVFAIQTPTISGAGAINVELAALNATLSTVAPTITTIRFVEVAAGAQNITFTIPAAAVGAGLSVNAVTQNASFSIIAVAITTGVNANPVTQNAIFATQVVGIIANRSVNLEPSVLNITFADVDPVITGGMIDVNAATANATFATHTVSILAVRNTTVSPAAATGVLAMPTASITAAIGAYVSAGLQNAVFALLSRTVDLNSVTLSLNVLNANFYLLRVPTIYTDKYSAKGTIYTDKYSKI